MCSNILLTDGLLDLTNMSDGRTHRQPCPKVRKCLEKLDANL
jgi:hypothetical protein